MTVIKQSDKDYVSPKGEHKFRWICRCDCGRNNAFVVRSDALLIGHTTSCSKCSQEQWESKIATECKQYFEENYNAIPEYRLLKNPKTNYWLRCDIYIPDNIFIEIHGGQHYKFTPYYHKDKDKFEYCQHLDKIKKEYCEENGIYIEIDLRKIKTPEEAIFYIEQILTRVLYLCSNEYN